MDKYVSVCINETPRYQRTYTVCYNKTVFQKITSPIFWVIFLEKQRPTIAERDNLLRTLIKDGEFVLIIFLIICQKVFFRFP